MQLEQCIFWAYYGVMISYRINAMRNFIVTITNPKITRSFIRRNEGDRQYIQMTFFENLMRVCYSYVCFYPVHPVCNEMMEVLKNRKEKYLSVTSIPAKNVNFCRHFHVSFVIFKYCIICMTCASWKIVLNSKFDWIILIFDKALNWILYTYCFNEYLLKYLWCTPLRLVVK